MAEISLSNHKKQGPGTVKTKKLSTRVDLTPMVDLGFLLITFFIFTTTVGQPTAMKLVMPDDRGDAMPTKEGGALTLLPTGNGNIYFYEGKLTGGNLKTLNLKELRNVIMNKKKRTPLKDLFLIIKPVKTSSYGDVVDLLDEMTIDNVRNYAIVDITREEEGLITP